MVSNCERCCSSAPNGERESRLCVPRIVWRVRGRGGARSLYGRVPRGTGVHRIADGEVSEDPRRCTLKALADYNQSTPVTMTDATEAIAEAHRFVKIIAGLIRNGPLVIDSLHPHRQG